MMYWIVNWSVKFRRIVIPVAAGLMILGFFQLADVKQDILPEFSPTTVEVQTEALGLSASEVEQLVTVPLEQDLLNGVAFLDTIESTSLPGLSSVVMTFEPGTDLLDARQVVAERLTQAAGLPQVADPPQMIQPLSSTSRVAMVSLSSGELSPIETSVLARWVMVPRLLGVEGVANVAIWGFRDQQLQVLVDPAELIAKNVALNQVISTAGNALEVSPLSFLEASSPGTGGFIDTVNQRLHVFHEQVITAPEQLAEVTVEGLEGGAVFVGGEALTLGDVAEIVTDHQPLIGDALCAGGPCVLLVIEKFPDANTPAVAAGIDEALEALSLGLPGMEIDSSVYRPAAFIDSSFGNLTQVLLIGLILALIALALLIFEWRIVLITAVSIALSLVASGIVLLVFDVAVNAMVLAGIVAALVMIVNDAVVGSLGVADAVRSTDEAHAGVVPAIVDSILRLRSIAVYSALIVAVAILPFAMMGGEAGAFLRPMLLAYLLAVAVALLVGATVAPALSVLLFSDTSSDSHESRVCATMRRWYRDLAPHLVPKVWPVVAVFGVFVVAGALAFATMNVNLRPSLQERDVVVHLEAAPGTSLPFMAEVTTQMTEDLRSEAGVSSAVAHVGRAIMSDQIVNVNSAEIWLSIDSSADYAATLAAINSVADGYEQVASRVETYSDQRVAAILDRNDDELVIRVYGENPTARREMAEEVRLAVAGVEGINALRIELPLEEPTLEIEVDLDKAKVFGVKPGDVRRQAATLVSGLVVGNLFEDQKVFDVVVWGKPGIREGIADVRAMQIATPSGDFVPLGELAEVRVASTPAVIEHESVATYVDVLATVNGRSLNAMAADVDVLLKDIDFPLEHHAEVVGAYAEADASRSRTIALVITAVVVVYLLLQAAFSSWRLATLAILALPMGVSGSLIAIALTGGEATLGSVAGVFAVLGLAAHGMVHVIRSYERRELYGEEFGDDLIVGETEHLIAPTVVSAVAIAVLFLPFVVAGSRPGLEIAGPMTAAVLGGLVTTVLLTLLVVPAVYLRWGHVADLDTSADDLLRHDEPVPTLSGGDA